MIRKAYRVAAAKDVEPGDQILAAGGPILVVKIEADADGYKFVGKKGNDPGHRAPPVTVSRGSNVVVVAGPDELDRIEASIVQQLAGGEYGIVDDKGALIVQLNGDDDGTWTVPLRGHEDAWLTSVLPAAPSAPAAAPAAPKDANTPPVTTAANSPAVESKGG